MQAGGALTSTGLSVMEPVVEQLPQRPRSKRSTLTVLTPLDQGLAFFADPVGFGLAE